MIVGLRNFHKRKDVVPDSNFWCGCPVKTGILLGEKVLFGVYISKRVVQKIGFLAYRMIYIDNDEEG